MEVNEIREFVEKQFRIFAKTYADKAPHEYIVCRTALMKRL